MAKPYESDITRFIRELKRKNPRLEEEQKKGRAIFWDKPQDLDTLKRDAESNIDQQAYVYQNKV
jgi:Protein of unknown function (DUF3460)